MPRPKAPNPTPAELEVLKILWEQGPATVRDVMEQLNPSRPRGYTSVMSLLNVMFDKKLLRRKPVGRAFLYSARVDQTKTLGKMVDDIRSRVFDGSSSLLVAHLLEQTAPTDDEVICPSVTGNHSVPPSTVFHSPPPVAPK